MDPSNLRLEHFQAVMAKPLRVAAQSLGVPVSDFIKRAYELRIYEWLGEKSEYVRHTYPMEEIIIEIFIKVMRCTVEKCVSQAKVIGVPGTFTLNKVKQRIAEEFQLTATVDSYEYEFKIDDTWVELKTPEEWDICVKIWINGCPKKVVVDVRFFPK